MFVYLSKLLPLFAYPLGLACCLLLFSLFIRSRRRMADTLLGVAFFVLWLSSTNWVGFSLMRSLEWQYFPPEVVPTADVIVVLGGVTRAAQYPRTAVELNEGADRLFYAAELYKQGKAPFVLLTGGHGPFQAAQNQPSEAEAMAEIIQKIGVPNDALWLENRARNTYENGLYSGDMLREANIKRILLVTSADHMPRSVRIFENQGFEVIPAPTDYIVTEQGWRFIWEPSVSVQFFNALPSVNGLAMTTEAIKEYMGLLVYGLRGWL